MSQDPSLIRAAQPAVADINDYVRADGTIVLPDYATVTWFFDQNRAAYGDRPSYKFIDYAKEQDGRVVELTWNELWSRVRSIGARLQQVTQPGDRVAILAPHGLDYVAAFFGTVHAGRVAVPLFAPTLSGHAERLAAVLGRCPAYRGSDHHRSGGVGSSFTALTSGGRAAASHRGRRDPRDARVDVHPA